MKHQETDNRFFEFSFEEFLQDDYFISSIISPTSESIEFWEQFVCENHSNLNHFKAAKRYIDSINSCHYTLSPAEIDKMYCDIFQKRSLKIPNRKLFYSFTGSIAAAIFVLLVYFLFHGVENQEAKNTDYVLLEVPFEKTINLILPDGTSVWINSGSQLKYPAVFKSDKREIYVEGEIYLEVAKETQRPFIVRTKNLDVQVLGTKLNINSYIPENEKVILISGSVEIISKKDNTITRLLPEQMYSIENGQSHINKVDMQKYISWIEGIYYFENENLGNILQRLSIHYGVEISCDPSISDVIFSGKLNLRESLSDIIEGISFTIPITFTENNRNYVISKFP